MSDFRLNPGIVGLHTSECLEMRCSHWTATIAEILTTIFWPHEHPLTDLLPEIRNRLIGHQQLTDAILLDLAIRQGGRLVTLDRRVTRLLPPDSPHLSSIEVISQ